MTLKDYTTQDPGFRYVVEQLELLSGVSRPMLNQTPFCTTADLLQRQWQEVETMQAAVVEEANAQAVADLAHDLMQVRDIFTTLVNCQKKVVLDDIQLFEIKNFAILAGDIAKQVSAMGIAAIATLPDLSEVVALLDPDRSGVPHFYVYDSYDSRLPLIRKELRALQAKSQPDAETEKCIADLWQQNAEVENEVRNSLSHSLSPFADDMISALRTIASIDILLAKCRLNQRYSLCKPTIGETVSYTGLMNIRLHDVLTEKGGHCQPVDISFGHGACVITGANMAGKTVLLKSLGVAQLMAQFGFYVPASSAQIVPVADVLLCVGDEQDEMSGLSSFASEMLKINNIIQQTKTRSLLVLIDEPARTTNPYEGMAIVDALVEYLNAQASFSLITTHYSGLGSSCKRLRVKGLRPDVEMPAKITPDNIGSLIDYTLTDDNAGNVPQEALRIAEMLHFDAQVLEKARKLLKT